MPTMICPKCNCKTTKNAIFCGKCGTKLVPVPEKVICQSCGAELKQNAEFCSQCGEKRKVVPTRKTSSRAGKKQEKRFGFQQGNDDNTPHGAIPKRGCWGRFVRLIQIILSIILLLLSVMAAKYVAKKVMDAINPYKNEGWAH